MRKLVAFLALAVLFIAGLSSAAPVSLLTAEPNTSTWVCMPIDVSLGNSDWYAGISRSPGLNGSYWKTEGAVASLAVSDAPELNRVVFNVFGNTYKQVSVDLTPWTMIGTSDVVTEFGLPDGTYVVNTAYPPNIGVTFRTYNDLGENGTYGATLPKLTAYTKSFVSWPSQVGRRWLYVVVLDNADFYIALYKYDGTLVYLGEENSAIFGYVRLFSRPVDPEVGFAVIELKPREGGQPGGYEYHPSVLPYGTGVDNLTGAPNIFTAVPALF